MLKFENSLRLSEKIVARYAESQVKRKKNNQKLKFLFNFFEFI